MKFFVTRKIEGEKTYLVEADCKETVQALFDLYFEPADFCPDIKILTDEAEETDITSIEQVEDDFYQEVNQEEV